MAGLTLLAGTPGHAGTKSLSVGQVQRHSPQGRAKSRWLRKLKGDRGGALCSRLGVFGCNSSSCHLSQFLSRGLRTPGHTHHQLHTQMFN